MKNFLYLIAPVECRKCGFKTRSILKAIHHIRKSHNLKNYKKNDIKFILRWNFLTKLLFFVFAHLTQIIFLIVWLITYPIWLIHEFFDIF